MHRLSRTFLRGSPLIALVTASLSPVQAQDTQAGGVENVVVSTSRVSIAGYSQPTPVTIIDEAQLQRDAYANISDALQQLPQLAIPPSSYSNQNGNGAAGTAGENLLNLRGLGQIRTLVLFDGQRVVASNILGGVDIDTIPSELVSRVDVVTGGASAAWGADAVAGVVNFVLDKRFNGLKGDVQLGDTYNDKYESLKAQFAWGGDILGGRGHLILAGDALVHPQVVTQSAEPWFRDTHLVSNPSYVKGSGQSQLILADDVGIASATRGGLIVASPAVAASKSPTGVAVPANSLRGIQFVGNGVLQTVNFGNVTAGTLSNGGSLTGADGEQPWTVIAQPNNQYTFFGYGSYALTDTIHASLQVNYGYFTGKDFAQTVLQTAENVTADNPYIPASLKATMTANGIPSFTMGIINSSNFDNRTVTNDDYFKVAQGGTGPTIFKNQRQLMRVVFTLDGSIGNNWHWSAYYEHSTVRFWTHAWANVYQPNLLLAEDAVSVTSANVGSTGLALGSIACRSTLTNPSNGCVPLDIFGENVASAAAVKYVTGNNRDFEDMQTNQDMAEISAQGTLPWGLPAGPVAVAFGASYRKEAGRIAAEPGGISTSWGVGNYVNFAGQYNIEEGFAEIDAPLLKDDWVQSLDFTGAGRMTSYSTSGLVETWKLGLISQVNEDFRLRTTWSVDIRAPALNELFATALILNGSDRDPKTGISVTDFSDTTGNPNLRPEVARTVSGGIVFTPHWIEGFQLSADWYSIHLTGEIAAITKNQILAACTLNINDPLCSQLIFKGPGGALSSVILQPINIASLSTSGLDLQGNYTTPFWEGDLSLQASANYVDEITQTQPGVATNDYAGVLGAGGASLFTGAPKWKGALSATYAAGAYSFTVQGRWMGTAILNNAWNDGNLATAATVDMVPSSVFHVPVTAYLDLRGSYKWTDNLSVYGAIDNLTNVPPPLVPLYSGNIIHAIPSSPFAYDLIGRQFRIGVRFAQ
jgi:outer membrane receptor protein involved in Fe transport